MFAGLDDYLSPLSIDRGCYDVTVVSVTWAVRIAICTCILLLKHALERGRYRSHHVFLLDTSKQVVGAVLLHLMNVVFAGVIRELQGFNCVGYWGSTVLDATVGVSIEYVFLQFMANVIFSESDDMNTGDYMDADDTFAVRKYLKQLGVWLLCVTAMRLTVLVPMFGFGDILHQLADIIAIPFGQHSASKYFVLMFVVPCAANAMQFIWTDRFIRKPIPREEVDALEEEILDLPGKEGCLGRCCGRKPKVTEQMASAEEPLLPEAAKSGAEDPEKPPARAPAERLPPTPSSLWVCFAFWDLLAVPFLVVVLLVPLGLKDD